MLPGIITLMALGNNERKTENLVRDKLRQLDYYRDDNDINVEEQKSNIESVKRLLKFASKSGQGGKGSPEFIISSASTPDFLVIIECKADVRDHISSSCQELLRGETIKENENEYAKRTQRYAVDGILHYAQFISKEYNVIAIAVTGENKKEAIISTYLHTKGTPKPKELQTKENKAIEDIIPWRDYIEYRTFDPSVQRMRFNELMVIF